MNGKIFLLLPLLMLASCSVNPPEKRMDANRAETLSEVISDEDSGFVMVVAHRGCWKSTAENSISSIRKCIELGVDIVELDVRRSRDDQLVLMHDETVNRTTNGRGAVSNLSSGEISNLFLRRQQGGTETAFLDEKVPTLREAYAAAKGKILINIDAKGDVVADAIKLAEEMDVSDQIIIKAELDANDPLLRDYRDLVKNGFFMPKITQSERPLSNVAAAFSYLKPTAIEVKASSEAYIKEGADDIEELGARFWINTLSESPEKAAGHVDNVAVSDPAKHWGKLIELGVDIIQTDEPELLIDYLKEANHRP